MSVSLHALFRHCVRLFSFLKQVVVTYLCFYTALDSSILENFNESVRIESCCASKFVAICMYFSWRGRVLCICLCALEAKIDPFSIYFDTKCFAIVKCLSWGRFLPVKVTKFSFVLWKINRWNFALREGFKSWLVELNLRGNYYQLNLGSDVRLFFMHWEFSICLRLFESKLQLNNCSVAHIFITEHSGSFQIRRLL